MHAYLCLRLLVLLLVLLQHRLFHAPSEAHHRLAGQRLGQVIVLLVVKLNRLHDEKLVPVVYACKQDASWYTATYKAYTTIIVHQYNI